MPRKKTRQRKQTKSGTTAAAVSRVPTVVEQSDELVITDADREEDETVPLARPVATLEWLFDPSRPHNEEEDNELMEASWRIARPIIRDMLQDMGSRAMVAGLVYSWMMNREATYNGLIDCGVAEEPLHAPMIFRELLRTIEPLVKANPDREDVFQHLATRGADLMSVSRPYIGNSVNMREFASELFFAVADGRLPSRAARQYFDHAVDEKAQDEIITDINLCDLFIETPSLSAGVRRFIPAQYLIDRWAPASTGPVSMVCANGLMDAWAHITDPAVKAQCTFTIQQITDAVKNGDHNGMTGGVLNRLLGLLNAPISAAEAHTLMECSPTARKIMHISHVPVTIGDDHKEVIAELANERAKYGRMVIRIFFGLPYLPAPLNIAAYLLPAPNADAHSLVVASQ